MQFNTLGTTGVKVSQLCFEGDADETTSTLMFWACRDAGKIFFDCADAFSRGKAEEILGRIMDSKRDELVITTKCHQPMADDINFAL